MDQKRPITTGGHSPGSKRRDGYASGIRSLLLHNRSLLTPFRMPQGGIYRRLPQTFVLHMPHTRKRWSRSARHHILKSRIYGGLYSGGKVPFIKDLYRAHRTHSTYREHRSARLTFLIVPFIVNCIGDREQILPIEHVE
jgi:hypothetical protein